MEKEIKITGDTSAAREDVVAVLVTSTEPHRQALGTSASTHPESALRWAMFMRRLVNGI